MGQRALRPEGERLKVNFPGPILRVSYPSSRLSLLGTMTLAIPAVAWAHAHTRELQDFLLGGGAQVSKDSGFGWASPTRGCGLPLLLDLSQEPAPGQAVVFFFTI